MASRSGFSLPTVRAAERGKGLLATFVALASALDKEIGGRSLPPGPTLGDRLAALRRRREIGRRTLADMTGISPTTLAALEREDGGHLATLVRIGDALGARLRLVPKGGPASFWSAAAISSAHHAWTTPSNVLERLYGVVGGRFGLDPCSPVRRGSKAPVRARLRYVAADDGLSLPWSAPSVFVNPPYGRGLRAWIAKAHEETASGRADLVIALIFARPDTGWWHGHVAGIADVWMLRGRLVFGSGTNVAPFPSAIVIWGATGVHRAAMLAAFPDAWHVPKGTAEMPSGQALVAE